MRLNHTIADHNFQWCIQNAVYFKQNASTILTNSQMHSASTDSKWFKNLYQTKHLCSQMSDSISIIHSNSEASGEMGDTVSISHCNNQSDYLGHLFSHEANDAIFITLCNSEWST